jgi:hypothetical protein
MWNEFVELYKKDFYPNLDHFYYVGAISPEDYARFNIKEYTMAASPILNQCLKPLCTKILLYGKSQTEALDSSFIKNFPNLTSLELCDVRLKFKTNQLYMLPESLDRFWIGNTIIESDVGANVWDFSQCVNLTHYIGDAQPILDSALKSVSHFNNLTTFWHCYSSLTTDPIFPETLTKLCLDRIDCYCYKFLSKLPSKLVTLTLWLYYDTDAIVNLFPNTNLDNIEIEINLGQHLKSFKFGIVFNFGENDSFYYYPVGLLENLPINLSSLELWRYVGHNKNYYSIMRKIKLIAKNNKWTATNCIVGIYNLQNKLSEFTVNKRKSGLKLLS